MAERSRHSVEQHVFMVDPEDDEPPIPLRLTASVGVAWLPECADSLERLVEVADRALYDAKRQGRNRVTVAPTVPRAAAHDPLVQPLGYSAANHPSILAAATG